MIATDGYPQSNINPEGHTPMNTPTITKAATRYLSVELLDLGEQCIGLMPGDTVHIEATIRVRAVQHGLDYKDEPTETVSVKPTGDKPDVVIRTSTWRALTEDGEQYDIDLTPAAETEPTEPTRRERYAAWKAAHRIELGIVGTALWAGLWLLAMSALIIGLAGCGTGSSTNTPSPSPAPAPAAVAAEKCRQVARAQFAALAADKTTQAKAQEEVDRACVSLSPTDRAAVIDAERAKAIADYLDKSEPTP